MAEEFDRDHKHLLEHIDQRLHCSDEFQSAHYWADFYLDSRNRKRPMYLLTRQGFMFLVMGVTGEKAASKP